MANAKIAVVFPGQGSQFVSMLADIAAVHTEVDETFSQASEVLNFDLWSLVQNGPAEKLDQTQYTQPALLASSYSIWRILQNKSDFQPAWLAGHSLGEYTALVCANALSFTDAVRTVAARGEYMQAAVPAGAGGMAAIIGLDDATVKTICERAIESTDEVLAPANYNSIGQTVIAGNIAPLQRAIAAAKESGAKLAVLLPVSVPSHCLLMKPAAERLSKCLDKIIFQKPTLPVISNTTVTPYETADEIRQGLLTQLFLPVRWVETIQYMAQQNVNEIIECGPGKVLTGLNKRIDKRLQLYNTNDVANLNALINKAQSKIA